MHIYLAGPMRGKALHNFPAFMEAAIHLRDLSHFVHNPAEKDLSVGFNPSLPCDHPDNVDVFSLKEAFEWDFAAIMNSEAVVLLPGWRASKGTQAEVVLALAIERSIWELKRKEDSEELYIERMFDTVYDVNFSY